MDKGKTAQSKIIAMLCSHLSFSSVCMPVCVRICACVCQTFVVVDIQVVWGREDGDEGGETCSLTLSVHAIPEERETNKTPTLQLLK